MDVLRIFYGCSKDFLWMFFGFSIDFLWMFYGCSMDVLWFSMDVLWMFYGCSMVFYRCSLNFYEFSMDVLWMLHGFSLNFSGFSLVLYYFLWNFFEFLWMFSGFSMDFLKLAENKVARCVLLDWKENANKLLAPMNPETNKPEITVTMRRKWFEDPVYGPSWIEELKKADAILTSPAARMALPGDAEGGGTYGSESQEAEAVSLPDEWQVRDKSGLAGLGHVHECASDIPKVTINVVEHEEKVQVFLTADGPMTIPADVVLFKMPAADL